MLQSLRSRVGHNLATEQQQLLAPFTEEKTEVQEAKEHSVVEVTVDFSLIIIFSNLFCPPLCILEESIPRTYPGHPPARVRLEYEQLSSPLAGVKAGQKCCYTNNNNVEVYRMVMLLRVRFV